MSIISSSSDSIDGGLDFHIGDKRAFNGITCKDLIAIIGTIVLPIILLAALGGSIYFGFKPLLIIYQVNAQFAISVPLLVCSSSGVFTLVTMMFPLVFHKSVKQSFDNFGGHFVHSCASVQENGVRKGLHEAGRLKMDEEVRTQEEENVNEALRQPEGLGFAKVTFKTRDGVTLRGLWKSQENPAKTVIVFHGNNYTVESELNDWGKYYNELGLNVLLVEYRGYGMSDGVAGTSRQELEAYLDAEAALRFVIDEGISKNDIFTHGYSLGGAYAASLGYFFGISLVILNHTFVSYPDVMHNASKKFLPKAMSREVVGASYETGHVPADPNIEGVQALHTDGFNSLQKVRKMDGEVFVIRGKKDALMPMSFGQKFVEAKYPENPEDQRAHLLTIKGPHRYHAEFFENEEAKHTLTTFLQTNGFVD